METENKKGKLKIKKRKTKTESENWKLVSDIGGKTDIGNWKRHNRNGN